MKWSIKLIVVIRYNHYIY